MEDKVKELLIDILKSGFREENDRKRNRKIIFWYDPKHEYEEFIDELQLEDAEVIKYDANSFWIRYHIEKEELIKDIVIYMPFEQPKGTDNELLDLETSNDDFIFNPDFTSIRLKELNLSQDCRNSINKYTKFFNDKKRELKFKEFDIEEKSNDNIDYIITSILLNIKSIKEDDILKGIIKLYYEDTKKYDDLFKFGDEKFILGLFNKSFGCLVENYSELQNVYKSLILTYFATSIKDIKRVNIYSNVLLLKKVTNVYVFVNSLMRDKNTTYYLEQLADKVQEEFKISEILEKMDIDEYISSDAFEIIDRFVIKYIVDKLESGVGEYEAYKEYIEVRESKYWAEKLKNEYNFLKVAITFFEKIQLLQNAIKVEDIDEFVLNYINNLYEVDMLYRKMYYYFDNIVDKDLFINIKNRIENVYANTFMSELGIKWSDMIEHMPKYTSNTMIAQNKFYDNYIKPFSDKKDRIIVIISDAFRYECAKELSNNLKSFGKNCEINCMLGLVPSYTKLGMAALLPNKELLRVQDSDDILVDGFPSSSIEDRQKILQKENLDAITVKYDDLYDITKTEWKKMFSGKKVVYIYHNTVDNMGEHNENKIFEACQDAIEEIERLIRDLHTTFGGVNVFVTADHGFFYKRSKLESYDKTNKDVNSTKQRTRYSYSKEKSCEEGIISLDLEYVFGQGSGYVNIPKGNIIYSRQGSGVNYVHGGILPQEIIIPVIDFKSSRSSEESKKVGITYSGLSTKITNPIVYLDFLQDANIDENNRPCRYVLHFEDELGNRVSDECTIIANYENTDVKKRIFKEKFVFKNILYDKYKPYYLIIIDEETELEQSRVKFYIDIAITNNFNF